ncbi:glycosyltransferase family 2 protein [Sulfuricurvum sp.]|uniref:glycosyltransferase family 2 protein n=1 Tax=Sulfuricurvum sp. TaxID=2025608 RepID=UPI003BB7E4EB
MNLISIAICTYNGEKYLQKQLESILHQTYQNIEVIVVDDRSKDSTMDILHNYQLQDKRLRIFQNEKNLGFVQNFSKAISLCNGDFIALADQDDIWKLNKIEKFIAEIGDNILIYSDAILIDEREQSLDKLLIRPENNLISGNCNKAFFFSNCVSGNTLMFKKELLSYILPIPDVSYHDIWIAYVASSIGTITYTDEPMTYYRRHNEQVTTLSIKIKKKNLHYRLNRIKLKAKEKQRIAQLKLQDFIPYRDFSIKIGDVKTTQILNALIKHFENYDSCFINYQLQKVLVQNVDELFAIVRKEKRLKRAKRAGYGLKFYLYTLFIL